MALLKNRSRRRSRLLKARPTKHSLVRQFTVIRCPLEGHQVSMCRGLCRPHAGLGYCGRLAPHALIGRTQQAIADDFRRRRGA